jgi:hypothetical protein
LPEGETLSGTTEVPKF